MASTLDLLLPPDLVAQTPSKAAGMSSQEEREYRFFGTQLIAEAGVILRVPQVVIATAQTCFQRMYFRQSFAAFDAHHVAMASLFLAAKVEESTRRMRDIVNATYHVKQRWDGASAGRGPSRPRPLTLGGNLYLTWKAGLVKAERFILKHTGFAMYALSDSHPHKLLLYYLKALGGDSQLAGLSWAALNDSLRTDLCVRAPPEAIACAAIVLASGQYVPERDEHGVVERSNGFPLPRASPWHSVFTTCTWDEVQGIAGEIRMEQGRVTPPVWLPSRRAEWRAADDEE